MSRLRIVLADDEDSTIGAARQADDSLVEETGQGGVPIILLGDKFYYDWWTVLLPAAVVVLLGVVLAPRGLVHAAANRMWKTSTLNNRQEDDLLVVFWNDDFPSLLPLVVVVGVPMMALFLLLFLSTILYARRRHRDCEIPQREEEFIVTVYPMGVQLSSPTGRRKKDGCFIARDQILDCRIQEVIQAHRVYSSPRLICTSQQNNADGGGQVETIELFPQLELSYQECEKVCRQLRKMLGLS
uniref:Uncharacterized protein n=1 Tax=Amphora coffeiformis TaxID=265554 RepID=A0A7S3LCB2_9STRA